MSRSSRLGVGSPDGWLWRTMRAAALPEDRRLEDLARVDEARAQAADAHDVDAGDTVLLVEEEREERLADRGRASAAKSRYTSEALGCAAAARWAARAISSTRTKSRACAAVEPDRREQEVERRCADARRLRLGGEGVRLRPLAVALAHRREERQGPGRGQAPPALRQHRFARGELTTPPGRAPGTAAPRARGPARPAARPPGRRWCSPRAARGRRPAPRGRAARRRLQIDRSPARSNVTSSRQPALRQRRVQSPLRPTAPGRSGSRAPA